MQNVAKKDSLIRANINRQLAKYNQKIIERNLLDLELYNYVKNVVLPREKKVYGPTFENDLKQFKKLEKRYSRNLLRYLYYVLKKCYYEPTLRFIRKVNELK